MILPRYFSNHDEIWTVKLVDMERHMEETSIIAGYKELKRQNKVGDPERHKLCMAANKILADSGLPEYLLSTLHAPLYPTFKAAPKWDRVDWNDDLQQLYEASKRKLESENDDWGDACDAPVPKVVAPEANAPEVLAAEAPAPEVPESVVLLETTPKKGNIFKKFINPN